MASDVDLGKLDVGKTRRRIEDALRKDATAKTLLNIARTLGVEPALVPDQPTLCHHCCTDTSAEPRPYFGPDQVRCRCQLKVGLKYQKMIVNMLPGQHPGASRPGEVFTVVKEPYFQNRERNSDLGSWWMKVTRGSIVIHTISLADSSVVPYEGSISNWNRWNWIAFTDESRPTCCCCHLSF